MPGFFARRRKSLAEAQKANPTTESSPCVLIKPRKHSIDHIEGEPLLSTSPGKNKGERRVSLRVSSSNEMNIDESE